MSKPTPPRQGIFLAPGQWRFYSMGSMQAVFKADLTETAQQYSISEWWLDPHSKGPGAHSHPEDDIFFVIEGVMSFLMDEQWLDAPQGSFILVPGGVVHDFENRSDRKAGALNITTPGGFEQHMPDIVQWFKNHPLGTA